MPLPPSYCRNILVGECPWGDRCRYRHDIVSCSCGLVLQEEHLRSHRRGNRHRQLLAELQARRETHQTDIPPAPNHLARDNQQPTKRCPTCRRFILESQYVAHTENHAQQQRIREVNELLSETERDKKGILVNWKGGVNFEVVEADTIVEVELLITNNGTKPVALQTCRVGKKRDRSEKHFTVRLRGRSKLVHPNAPRTIRVRFVGSDAGRYEDTLELVFAELTPRNTFVVTRKLSATIGDPEDHERLKPEAPYTRTKGPIINLSGKILPTTRPPDWTKSTWTEVLPKYDVPKYVVDAAFGAQSRNAVQNVRRLMPTEFNVQTYGAWFTYPLYVEEEQLRQDLLEYAMTDVELTADYPRYNLQVKGLAEGRPSVLVGDYILVSRTGEGEDGSARTWYQGRVHKVFLDHVSLRFRDGFNIYRGTRFDVQFVFNRICYRRMYHILNNGFNPKRLLFPGPEHLVGLHPPTAAQKRNINLINRQLEGDDEQLETVAAIVNLPPGSVPFIIFGPPGTGKTVTLVEAMQQILSSNPDARILACAPNNSAADLIAQKLMHLGRSTVFRLNAITRSVEESPKSLREFCLINDNTVFAVPHVDVLAKYRVVVSTCLSGGNPASLGLKRGHFSHIFIDEAGQGKEPEVMVPIKSIAGKNTNVILAGDHQQLGPIVQSGVSRLLGLKTSYLSRLTAMDIYNVDGNRTGPGGRGVTIIKLVKNFRSHPAILHYPNERFYRSELQSCGDPALLQSLENAEELPRKRFPIIFHGIVGKDEQEKRSPSFFNIDEATLVKKYCESLINNRKNSIRAEHIGVITPYHAQRCKVKSLLDRHPKLEGITVGSVEQFQGQERRIIIISTVRSNQNYVAADIRRSLGFIADARRFNVAITRAQAMLIVIGNPIVLSLDPLWRGFMNYVYLRGGWKGKKIDWDPNAPVDQDFHYDAERKEKAKRESEETLTRLKSLIAQIHEDSDFEIDIEDDDDDDDGAAGAVERAIIRENE